MNRTRNPLPFYHDMKENVLCHHMSEHTHPPLLALSFLCSFAISWCLLKGVAAGGVNELTDLGNNRVYKLSLQVWL